MHIYYRQLRNQINDVFTLEELRELCFDLGIDFDNLPGEAKSSKIQSLIIHFANRNHLESLLEHLRKKRPQFIWNSPPPINRQITIHENNISNRKAKIISVLVNKFSISKVVSILGILAIVILVLSRGPDVYNWFFRYSRIAPSLIPIQLDFAESNSEIDAYVAQNPNFPDPLVWYELDSSTFTPSTTPLINYSKIDHYLYYSSNLFADTGWTALFFWRPRHVPPLNASEESELILIIFAEEKDVLEIGFKDNHDKETKIPLNVVEGWAGYRIPLSQFTFIDFNKIRLFTFAHTQGTGITNSNNFKLAWIELR